MKKIPCFTHHFIGLVGFRIMETNGGAGDWKSRLTGKKRMITRLPLGSVKYKVILCNISFLLKTQELLNFILKMWWTGWFFVLLLHILWKDLHIHHSSSVIDSYPKFHGHGVVQFSSRQPISYKPAAKG